MLYEKGCHTCCLVLNNFFFIKYDWSRIKKSSPLNIIYNIQSLFNWRFCLYIISALYVLSSDIVSKVNSSINILLFIEYICKVSQNEKIHFKLFSSFLFFSHFKMITMGKIHVCSILNVLFQDIIWQSHQCLERVTQNI